jgi:hypothetical protein
LKIDEGIKRLTEQANLLRNNDRLEDADACQLGISALKRMRGLRKDWSKHVTLKLYGETET